MDHEHNFVWLNADCYSHHVSLMPLAICLNITWTDAPCKSKQVLYSDLISNRVAGGQPRFVDKKRLYVKQKLRKTP